MKILFTGHKGRIGTSMAAYLCTRHEVFGFDLVDGKDICDFDGLLESSEGMDAIVHLAAIPRPEPDRPFADYFMANVLGTFHVCEAARQNKIKRVVFTSSQARYGYFGGRGYGTSKRICEEIVSFYAAGHRTKLPLGRKSTFKHEDQLADFTGIVLRLQGYGSVGDELMKEALDMALGWNKGTFACFNVGSSDWRDWWGEDAPYAGEGISECSSST